MPLSRLNPADHAILACATTLGPAWLRSRRATYRPAGHPLRDHERAAFAGFFSPHLLEQVRVARVEQFERWPLESLLARVGLRGLLASQTIAGIALIDTVVLVLPAMHERHLAPLSLVFHELVHIEQYRQLGLRPFIRAYTRSWLEAGRSYLDIPLEDQAYRLGERYDADPSHPFDVAEEVRRAIDEWGLRGSRKAPD